MAENKKTNVNKPSGTGGGAGRGSELGHVVQDSLRKNINESRTTVTNTRPAPDNPSTTKKTDNK